jgi:predicted ATPase
MLVCMGDDRLLAESANELTAVTDEQGFPYWQKQAEVYQGWLQIRYGDVQRGLQRLHAGLIAFRALGAELWTPCYDALEAEAEALAGNIDMSLNILDKALRNSRARGESWFEAELVRRWGELLRDPQPTIAEERFREALDIARRQEAKLWELRAAESLARLWSLQGRQARDLLAPVYGWFTDGFDTPDLKEAKALLDELA